jgi:hypothetical protein
MRAEINNHLPFVNDRTQIIALIDLAGNLKLGDMRCAPEKGLAHAAF